MTERLEIGHVAGADIRSLRIAPQAREALPQGKEKNDEREDLARAPALADRRAKIAGKHRDEKGDNQGDDYPEHRDFVTVRLKYAVDAEGEVETDENRHEKNE